MKYRPISGYEEHEKNPFLEKAIGEITFTSKKIPLQQDKGTGITVVDENGVCLATPQFYKTIKVDQEKFTKIYESKIKAFFDLPVQSIRVFFGYILPNLRPNNDIFSFNLQKCLAMTGYVGENAVITGLSGLIKAGIIAKTVWKNEYFINPTIAFNGDRFMMVEEFINTGLAKDKEKNEIEPEEKIRNFENEGRAA